MSPWALLLDQEEGLHGLEQGGSDLQGPQAGGLFRVQGGGRVSETPEDGIFAVSA